MEEGRPIAEHEGYQPVLVWDDYHGFIVGRRQLRGGGWVLDLPWGFESGGREIDIEPVLWWPLPTVPEHMRRPVPAHEAADLS